MDGTAIGRYLLATLRHAIVANDGSDQQTIVAKDAFGRPTAPDDALPGRPSECVVLLIT